MSSQHQCTQCGAEILPELADGVCRGCLLKLGLDDLGALGPLNVRCPGCQQLTCVGDGADLRDAKCSGCGRRFSVIDESDCACATVGRFDLLERIGSGGFGTVWRARDRQLDRVVVVKVPHAGRLLPQEADRFMREARAAAQLRHPGIATVLEAGREEGQVYIVSEFISGCNLAERMEIEPVSAREAASLCAEIADALQHARDRREIRAMPTPRGSSASPKERRWSRRIECAVASAICYERKSPIPSRRLMKWMTRFTPSLPPSDHPEALSRISCKVLPVFR